ncbi:MAG: hypothetical protein WC342_07640 [Methanoregula sp.]|jgi:hypothetical protein
MIPPANRSLSIAILIVTGLAMLFLFIGSLQGFPGPAPIQSYSVVRAHINPTVPWDTDNTSSIGHEIDLLVKPETILSGIAACNLSGPIRTDTLVATTESNLTASAVFTLYKEESADPAYIAYDYYLVWIKAVGSSNPAIPGNNSEITQLRSGIMLENTSDRITDWSPYTDTSGPAVPHEETVELGMCRIISEDYTLVQGRTGVGSIYPGTDNTTGNFTIRWQGHLNGTQAMVGGAEIRVPKNASYNYTLVLDVLGVVTR